MERRKTKKQKKNQHINRRNIGKTDLTRSKIGSGAVALPQDRFSVMKPSGFIWYLWQLTLVCMPCSRQRRGRKLGHWAACILMVFGFVFMWLGITSLPCSSATHNVASTSGGRDFKMCSCRIFQKQKASRRAKEADMRSSDAFVLLP